MKFSRLSLLSLCVTIHAVPAALQNFKGNPTNAGPFWNVHEWEIRR